MIDRDEFTGQAILKFSDITKNKSIEATSQPTREESQASKEDMEMKIATAKLHASKEIKAFKEATEEYLKTISGLVLFNNVEGIIEELMIDQLLDNLISPVVKGKGVPGMPEETYRDLRKEMFRALIKEYTN